jgi:hypothetical protein
MLVEKKASFMTKTPTTQAFSLLTVIGLILMVSMFGLLTLELSSKITKETYQQYQHEQAKLLAISYTKLAIIAVQKNSESFELNLTHAEGNTTIQTQRLTYCIRDINTKKEHLFNGFRIRVRLHYIGHNQANLQSCKLQNQSRILSTTNQTYTTPITLIIDTYVDYKDTTLYPTLENRYIPYITYHQRTVEQL